jgi:hypothetical protein
MGNCPTIEGVSAEDHGLGTEVPDEVLNRPQGRGVMYLN